VRIETLPHAFALHFDDSGSRELRKICISRIKSSGASVHDPKCAVALSKLAELFFLHSQPQNYRIAVLDLVLACRYPDYAI